MIPPKRLVLSGGGVKVIATVGALLHLEKLGYLKACREICGVSAGAWLGFLMAVGYPLRKIYTLVKELDFSVIRNVSTESILGFPELFGIDNGSKLSNFLDSLMRHVLQKDPAMTFADLQAAGGLTFRCWATDLATQKPREFSFQTTPSVKILDALRCSMALPLYFTPGLDPITGHLLGDGAIMANLPLCHLTPEEIQHSLSLAFVKSNDPEVTKNPSNVMQFTVSIMRCLTSSRMKKMMEDYKDKILLIPVDEYPSWNFELSREDRSMLIKRGREAAESWLANPPRNSHGVGLRRASI